MQKSVRFMASILILGAYLLSACTGAAPSQSSDPAKAQKVDSSEVVFTGIVEAISGNQWTVNGQTVVIDGLTALDVNIKVGDVVKVEANVSQDGSVVAVKIESSVADDTNSNSSNDNSGIANDSNANDANANSNDDTNANGNGNGNTSTNGNDNNAVDGQDEVFGVVEVVTSDTITVDGIVYNLADFTEFKDGIVVGDLVKIHVIVNADGTLTIREIEKSTGMGADDNSNGNSNSDDQVGNSNGNSNGDDDGDNSNDDDKDDDNSNDNSSGDDDSSNSNSNDD